MGFSLILLTRMRRRMRKRFGRTKRGQEIHHPTLTDKEYRTLVLDNGLSVLLVSSKKGFHCAAALSVKSGSFADPPEMQGLSHVLEHVLFLGSVDYPGENQFREFVQRYSGQVNGMTELDYSVFSMAIKGEYFEDALQMFADMFINPCFDFELFKKELMTIDSEFELRKYRDSVRFEELLSHTATETHPFHRFTWGNNKSFSASDPKTLHLGAKKLFNDNFIASNMKLVLVAQTSLNDLEYMAVAYFSGLKKDQIGKGDALNLQKTDPSFKTSYSLCGTAYHKPVFANNIWESGVSYLLESLEGEQLFQLSWVLPPMNYDSRPERLIANLLGQENEGSLSYVLKRKGWVTSFACSVGNDIDFGDDDRSCPFNSTSECQLFIIQCFITNSGLEKKYDLVSYVYQYLNLLSFQRLSPSLIEEYSTSLKMKFEAMDLDYNLTGVPCLFAQGLAGNMLKGPLSHALCLDFLYEFGDEAAMQDILKYLTPNNMRIDVYSKPFTDGVIETVPFVDAKFKVETIPAPYIDTWHNKTGGIDPSLRLPTPNVYMPSQFFHAVGIVTSRGIASSFDICLNELSNKLFHKPELDTLLSSAYFNIYLNVGHDVKANMITKIFIEMVKQDLNAIFFKGDEAYINTRISFGDDNTLELRFHGFNERFKEFITEIWSKIKSFSPNEESFKIIREKMQREFTSRDLAKQADQLLSNAIIEGSFAEEFVGNDNTFADEVYFNKFKELTNATFEDVKSFSFPSEIRVVGVCSGKLSRIESEEILSLFEANGHFQIPKFLGKKKVLTPGTPWKINAKPKTKSETNSLAMVYFQVTCEKDDSDGATAFLHIFKAMIEEFIYCQLRQKERLGYDLGCGIHFKSGISGFFIYVVSPCHQPQDLLERIYTFVGTIGEFLEGVNESRFKSYRESAYDFFHDDSGISHDLFHDDCIDGRCEGVLKLLTTMSKEEIIVFFERFFTKEYISIEICISSDQK